VPFWPDYADAFEFCQDGVLTSDEVALFRVLFDLRHEGDYEDFIDVDRADIEEYTPQVVALVGKLKQLVEETINNNV